MTSFTKSVEYVIYKNINRKRWIYITGLILALFFFTVVDIASGVSHFTIDQIIKTLLTPNEVDSLVHTIIWTMRLPVALTAVVVGASLGLGGAMMQTILGNPLASPYTLGVGSGAAFGASLAVILGGSFFSFTGNLAIPISSFFFAMLVSISIYGISQIGNTTTETMILSGIAMLFLFQALQALIQYYASEGDLQAIVFWTFGNLQKTTWGKMTAIGSIYLLSMPIVMKDSWRYTSLLLGDEKAESLGIEVKKLKMKAFIIVSLLSAISVCFVGTIGFIGLAGPHIARVLSGEDQRFFLPMSSLCGALIMSASSLISKSIMPGSIFPIGIVTSVIGVPFFFALIIIRKRSFT